MPGWQGRGRRLTQVWVHLLQVRRQPAVAILDQLHQHLAAHGPQAGPGAARAGAQGGRRHTRAESARVDRGGRGRRAWAGTGSGGRRRHPAAGGVPELPLTRAWCRAAPAEAAAGRRPRLPPPPPARRRGSEGSRPRRRRRQTRPPAPPGDPGTAGGWMQGPGPGCRRGEGREGGAGQGGRGAEVGRLRNSAGRGGGTGSRKAGGRGLAGSHAATAPGRHRQQQQHWQHQPCSRGSRESGRRRRRCLSRGGTLGGARIEQVEEQPHQQLAQRLLHLRPERKDSGAGRKT